MKYLLRLSLLGIALVPAVAIAHGTMQKIVEGKYLMNMSSAPIAPYVGQEQQNILAVSDLRENVIDRKTFFDIQIRKNETVISEFQNLVATGGLLSFHYTYATAGTYELAPSFHFEGDTHEYTPEDYWVQVVPKQNAVPAAPVAALPTEPHRNVLDGIVGFVIGMIVGSIIERRRRGR